ncbi:tRNA (N(6)-L-threonylcarbamoyladenosine(37)-C(2))-methylthiotransferase MtaB [Thiocapsa imhoffii]|uniref:tRNA (N(6)-L-threonylcarbamoyladenosine(37)-C(2))-methylthiotransferase MtaB n=1 Tax=Thiocapsa imhoffii TaxID=382777 RepID=A0A9X0WFY1_9GAMM|nr:tRNA (N(6)-L-threonylcarbamoyladenosine(37)-C(2))-methylthiotransferase MtaB [Thiocapsa imhoffii]MBK1643447.1 tRNA (N(6)-L-threonylcarbamoyladenosine(37)-C(2))-methylthiotransferase MtaB [Thiocapsa imhoffii]
MSRDATRGARVRIATLGCRLNEAEAEEWARQFRDQGCQIVDTNEDADLIVINSCAVTHTAVRKSRQLLRRSQRADPAARVALSGCVATLGDPSIESAGAVDLVVVNDDKERLVELALQTLNRSPERIRDRPDPLETPNDAGLLLARGRQRAFIKVQDGCRYQCTFCITTQARGEERSRAPEQILEQIERLVAQGITEVVLTGVQLGGYGGERGPDLVELITLILRETDVSRLRLGSLEPWDLQDAFWRLFEDPRLLPHLHLPLQSGSDAVLRRMARRCKTQDFARLVAQARTLVPALNITTDIIVGFPGETHQDWQQTLSFAQAMQFGDIHAFGFSPRPGTRAAELSHRVDPATQAARLTELRALAQSMRHERLRRRVGQRTRVLCEGHSGTSQPDWLLGYSDDYLPVRIATAGSRIQVNQILEVQLSGLTGDGQSLVGEPIEDAATAHRARPCPPAHSEPHPPSRRR